MALTRNLHRVTSAATGDTTAFVGGVLTVDLAGAAALVRDPALAEVRVSWVSPGDPVRIVKVLDAVQPRTKGPGGGGIFPGLLGPAVPQGTGVTHVLADTAVVVAGFLPRAQEAVVDMSGPAAELSPLATTHNLVIEFTPASEARWEDVDLALRRGSLSLAARLAETVLG
ncbi:MAG: glycine/sarcosine/betaine reductase component B subunit, partial [Acidimicrobiales bacterium]